MVILATPSPESSYLMSVQSPTACQSAPGRTVETDGSE